MAWVATDNAESYSAGNSISGLAGGSDWNGNWTVAGAGTKDIVSSPTLQGSLCFRLDKVNAEPEALRVVTNITSGTFSWIGRTNNVTTDADILGIVESGSAKGYVGFDNNTVGGFGDAHLVMTSGAGYFDLGTFSVDTNYTFVVDFDNSADQWRISTDGGSTFSAFKAYASTATNINQLRFRIAQEISTGNSFFFDAIQPYSLTSIKTWDGLARASVKTMDGLAIASVKTWNGLA